MGWGLPHEIMDTLEGGEAISPVTQFSVGGQGPHKPLGGLSKLFFENALGDEWPSQPLCSHRYENTLQYCYVMNSVHLLSRDVV